MPTYDGGRYSPPAAVATVIVLSLDSGAAVESVSMFLDSGADISCLPRPVVEALALPIGDQSYEIMAYDNSTRECATVLSASYGVSSQVILRPAVLWAPGRRALRVERSSSFGLTKTGCAFRVVG